MATITHYIRSSYSPSQRDRLLRETGQPVPSTPRSTSLPTRRTETEEDLDDAWRIESTFGAQRRVAKAPKFVKSKLQYDEFGNVIGGLEGLFDEEKKGKERALQQEQEKGVAGWYRALVSAREKRAAELDRLEKGEDSEATVSSASPGLGSRQKQEQRMEIASMSGVQPLVTANASATPIPPATIESSHQVQLQAPAAHHLHHSNWFTIHPLPSSTPSARTTSTLADILARDPPPDTKAKDKPFKPPVFLHLTPDNVGWRMLENSGWREGEGLGVNVKRRKVKLKMDETGRGEKERETKDGVRTDKKVVEIVDVDEFVESRVGKGKSVEVIDLTGDDEEAKGKGEEDFEESTKLDLDMTDVSLSGSEVTDDEDNEESEDSFELDPTRTTLLTPLPTVLKADKLGIGLHHRRVRRKHAKRVTHKPTSEAMKEHIRRGEQTRRKQLEVGRGRRGFERMRRKEEDERRRLIGYMNT
ncbi:hypothetical protein NEOLEDRAFT_1182897 [Neolentinus lepideus HHB14362 ss-1]|uniref:G-patch domain-containing protein n=1 Tax=Neolentinus lepideus HHB14362 ss-1 TaxID=1314782 RepID=A0A165NQK6_9AGAM|nr:hypothetical protein NEOLEDRAFT_1182897 [Neolentinus lepideus HHB14362 ss-1]